ncbi:M56 family metallopeptidase [Paenibacillus wulumuqiensis]|uniref:M56 family metallopeptidase n=1 Tax=Paenibacillus wulumuqiensis TaxID=1567107 RepID=UPI00138E133E|nr:M56 family metallopeptidase [Paenibacillus wulumuqiensis]
MDWSKQERTEYVPMHEYMHIRRLDSLVKMLLILVLCLHWYNPFVWIMFLLVNRDLELCCDESF